ncbi:hypothetical protein BC827DRAFT_519691 [Russula dissimulans]|nr:hypothetical protein BC827DRAFT_519691 [Russula dissimulans]
MTSYGGRPDSSRATWRNMGLTRWRRDHPERNSSSVEVHSASASSGASRPIHHLPVEILQRIFTCAAEPRSPDHDPFLQVYPEWIAITYVCRHWRAVALNHHSLWASITPNLSLPWLKVLMDRSAPVLVDAELRVGQATVKLICLCMDDIIALLSDCARLRSLRLVGPRQDVCAVLDALRITMPLQSLTLSLWERGPPVVLSEDLFGGHAPIRHIHFTADRYIVAPRWILRGITHFTSGEQIPLLALLDALSQMPALSHFTLQHCRSPWEDTDAPHGPLIELPLLKQFEVYADTPRYFVLLSQRLAIPRGARRLLELRTLAISGWDRWLRWFNALLPTIEAANGLQHVYLSGGTKEGTFRTWTGDDMTPWEDAELCFEMYWYGSPTTAETNVPYTSPILHLGALCDLLGATKCARRLVLEGDLASTQLPSSFWWKLLGKLPAVEILELHPSAVKALYAAWDDGGAPAVLPASRRAQLLEVTSDARTDVAGTTVVESGMRIRTLRRGFISRILPSKMAKLSSRPRNITWAPRRTDDTLPSAVHISKSNSSLEGLIALLQGDAGPDSR